MVLSWTIWCPTGCGAEATASDRERAGDPWEAAWDRMVEHLRRAHGVGEELARDFASATGFRRDGIGFGVPRSLRGARVVVGPPEASALRAARAFAAVRPEGDPRTLAFADHLR